MNHKKTLTAIVPLFSILFFLNTGCNSGQSASDKSFKDSVSKEQEVDKRKVEKKPLDTALYNKLMQNLANHDTTGKWPQKFPYPLPGAVLPFHRIVAYYGNLYSKRMGILGELPKNEMLKK